MIRSFSAIALLLSLVSTNAQTEPTATPVERLVIPDGFAVELLYTVPKERQGSWVVLCKDDKGRLIAGDQYGSLYRMSAPAAGKTLAEGDIEKIDLDIGHAWGLCHAFGNLYAVVNDKAHGGRGLYRITDSDNDDRFDKVELLKKFEEVGGEHGPHAVVPGPDGESLYVVCGNQTSLPEGYDRSRVPEVWGEDNLLPRVYGKGFMKGVHAPRGWIAKTDKDGKEWEIISTGFRNQYDIDFNRDGEIFTYDADMEWDMNTPWYRPTRVNHAISGAEFGWRNGSAKWPDYYSDSFGSVVDIGPGSPTGVTFGYGARFPAKYQNAFFIADWSFGKLYAVHLEPHGSTYKARFEEFISGQPFPLTDLTVGDDGALYCAIGGRRVQSGLYRITYTGPESTAAVKATPDAGIAARKTRHALEEYHLKKDPKAIDDAWPFLSSEDRGLRFAARTAIEHQPVEQWAERALAETDPAASTAAIMALARTGKPVHQAAAVAALDRLNYSELKRQGRYDLLRAYALVFLRLGEPTAEQKASLLAELDPHFPAGNMPENIELSNLLAYLGSRELVAKAVAQIEVAPTQEEQIALAKNIRHLTVGWTNTTQERYFRWMVRASGYKGGASFSQFIAEIKKDAVSKLPEARKVALQEILEAKPASSTPQFVTEPRGFVKAWKMEDLTHLLASGLEGNRDFENGRTMFGAATCYACHRFNNDGGAIGPDLTSVRGKFSPTDLLTSIIDPGKEISDQYGSMIFTMKDGSVTIGRIANLSGDSYKVITDLLHPGEMVSVDSKKVAKIEKNPISMMPPGLLNTLSDDDILDLLAFLLSAGDKEDPLFQE